ncbi:type II toxin-antitoxin system HicB family antitoxin [candidate division KSB1 bacterium]|nr:type II toxin-antitoxin system HicB family antitoxin [candidate division KSB1 bacterium]
MKIELPIDYFEEDGTIVALCPTLQVSSFGDTLDEAEKSIKEALELFIEGCETLGTINEVLEESGFRKIGDKWVPRKPIKTKKTTLQRATGAAFYV